MPARQSELENRIFKDNSGNLREGQYFLDIPNTNYTTGSLSTELHFANGKIHGTPAIIYPDGLEETWEGGKFVKIHLESYSNR